MDSIESKGKTVDEAIFNGLTEMGLGIDEVDIEILHEGSKGLFGLGKSAQVRITKKQTASQPGKITNANENGAGAQSKSKAGVSVAPAGEPEAFLTGLFTRMQVDAACETKSDDGKTVSIELTGKDTAVLIGRRGDTLDAIQYLTGLVINRGKEDYKKVMLDAENYRQKREVTLEKLAKRLANNVIRSGKPVTLEPMNPYERRILHATLQNNPKVETYSEGEEPYRRVVIRRKRRSGGGRPHDHHEHQHRAPQREEQE